MKSVIRMLGLAGLLTAVSSSASIADPVEDFYKGKTVTVLAGFVPGGGHDVYMRAVARHIGPHIPGRPNVVPQNMPGAGGITMLNHLYAVAPQDGSVIAETPATLAVDPLYGNPGAKYDVKKFGWLGSVTKDLTQVCLAWHTSKIKKIDDAIEHEMLVGSTGQTSSTTFYPKLLNSLIGTKFKIISGYANSGAMGIAMEQGELDGLCGLSVGTIKSAQPRWFADNQVNLLLQLSLQRSREYQTVPSVLDFAKDETTKQMLNLIFGLSDMNRPFVAPPNIPADRLAALRKAFDETMKDPEFLDDAKKTKLEVDPITGVAIEQILERQYATPRATVEKVKVIRDGQ
jgi:tripartite-type tricarboxylate transporter receptor subunit TctC